MEKEVIKLNIPNIENKIKINWNNFDIEKFQPKNKYKFKKELKIPEKQSILYLLDISSKPIAIKTIKKEKSVFVLNIEYRKLF